jgi:hypothetical protein
VTRACCLPAVLREMWELLRCGWVLQPWAWNPRPIRTLLHHNKRREQAMRGVEMDWRQAMRGVEMDWRQAMRGEEMDWRTRTFLWVIAFLIPIIILLSLFHSNQVGCFLQ